MHHYGDDFSAETVLRTSLGVSAQQQFMKQGIDAAAKLTAANHAVTVMAIQLHPLSSAHDIAHQCMHGTS